MIFRKRARSDRMESRTQTDTLSYIWKNRRFELKSWVAVGGIIKINNTHIPRFINDYILRD